MAASWTLWFLPFTAAAADGNLCQRPSPSFGVDWYAPLVGYYQCIQAGATCQDGGSPGFFDCNGGADCYQEFPVFLSTHWHVEGWQFCPRTCGMCDLPQHSAMTVSVATPPCEPGWNFSSGACFRFFGSDLLNWHQAERACVAEGAHLATIDTVHQNSLVTELFRRSSALRPDWAWIGLRGECNTNSYLGTWTWNATGAMFKWEWWWHEHLLQWRPWCWAATNMTMAAALYHTGGWITRDVTSPMNGWVCSKIARFKIVWSGTCEDAGLQPIHDLLACEVAARSLGVIDAGAAIAFAFRVGSKKCNFRPCPSGCTHATWPDAEALFGGKLFVFRHAGPDSGPAAPGFGLVCGPRASASSTLLPGTGGPRPTQAPVPGVQSSAIPLPWFLAAGCLLAALPLLRWLAKAPLARLAEAWRSFSHLRSLCECWGRTLASSEERRLQLFAADKTSARRGGWARPATLVLVVFHLLRLTLLAFNNATPCTTGSHVNLKLAGMQLANLGVLTAFLTVFLRPVFWQRLLLLCCLLALDLAEAAIIPNAMLGRGQAEGQLVWRLLLGACLELGPALIASAIYSAGLCVLYAWTIPNGRVVVGNVGQQLLVHHTCSRLWDAELLGEWTQSLNDFADSSVFQGMGQTDFTRELFGLFEELKRSRTSVVEFATSEALLLMTVACCLLVLQRLLHDEISGALRLQSSQDRLSAVSEILRRLCDAVVHLTPDLTIAQPAPELDALLHFGPRPGSLMGSDFRLSIASEDERRRFEEAVSAAPEDPAGTPAQLLTLKDSCGAPVRTQVVYASFPDLAGKPRFVCGINELGERQQPEAGPGPASGVTGAPHPVTSPPSSRCSTPPRSRSSGRRFDNDSQQSRVKDVSDQGIWAEVEVQTMRIVSQSRSWLKFVEPTTSAHEPPSSLRLSDYLLDPPAFESWIRERLDDPRSSGEAEEHLLKFKTYRDQGRRRRVAVYFVQVIVAFPEVPASGVPEGHTVVCIVQRYQHVDGAIEHNDQVHRGTRAEAHQPRELMPSRSQVTPALMGRSHL